MATKQKIGEKLMMFVMTTMMMLWFVDGSGTKTLGSVTNVAPGVSSELKALTPCEMANRYQAGCFQRHTDPFCKLVWENYRKCHGGLDGMKTLGSVTNVAPGVSSELKASTPCEMANRYQSYCFQRHTDPFCKLVWENYRKCHGGLDGGLDVPMPRVSSELKASTPCEMADRYHAYCFQRHHDPFCKLVWENYRKCHGGLDGGLDVPMPRVSSELKASTPCEMVDRYYLHCFQYHDKFCQLVRENYRKCHGGLDVGLDVPMPPPRHP